MTEPWLPYLATEFIAGKILPRWRCFEWGSGASTRWLAARCQHVVTVDHDADWQKDLPGNVSALFIIPEQGEIGNDPSEPAHYRSGSTVLGPGRNWKKYVTIIDGYDTFDLILIDGMARASCIAHAVPHVKPGGWLVIDNTGDRPYYLAKTAHLFGNWDGGWDKLTFFGHGPILDYLWECTMFRRPNG